MVNLLSKLSNENVSDVWANVKKVKIESLYKGNTDVDCPDYEFQRSKYIAVSMDNLGTISVI